MTQKFQEERTCACCGKTIYVLHPSRWALKKPKKNTGGQDYFCSWKCLRACEAAEEKKPKRAEDQPEKERHNKAEVLEEMIEWVEAGGNPLDFLHKMGYADPTETIRRLRIYARENEPKMYKRLEKNGLIDLRKSRKDRKEMKAILTEEQKKKALEIKKAGGDPIQYLKDCGVKNPYASMAYIEKVAEKEKKALAEVSKTLPEEAKQEKTNKPSRPIKTEISITLDKNGLRMTPQMSHGGLYVICVKGEFGEYSYTENGNIVFKSQTERNYLLIKKEDLEAFINELQRAGEILGGN